jgi:hypothetical protein
MVVSPSTETVRADPSCLHAGGSRNDQKDFRLPGRGREHANAHRPHFASGCENGCAVPLPSRASRNSHTIHDATTDAHACCGWDERFGQIMLTPRIGRGYRKVVSMCDRVPPLSVLGFRYHGDFFSVAVVTMCNSQECVSSTRRLRRYCEVF